MLLTMMHGTLSGNFQYESTSCTRSDKITCARVQYKRGRCIRSFFTGTAHAQALGFWISLVYLSSLHKIPRSPCRFCSMDDFTNTVHRAKSSRGIEVN